MKMDADEFRAAITDLGYTITGFATFIRVDVRTVRRWVSGEQTVPGWAEVIIRLLREARKVHAVAA